MQSLTWYLRRLQSMSASELAWRLRSTLRDSVDQPRFSLGLFPGPEVIPSLNGNTEEKLPFRVSDMRVGEWAAGEDESAERAWYRCLIHQADQIAAHRLSFFNLESHDLGSPSETVLSFVPNRFRLFLLCMQIHLHNLFNRRECQRDC